MLQQMKSSDWTHILEKIFIYYIVGQPILDMTAFLQWPASEYIRVSALFLGILYLFTHPHTNLCIKARWYLIALFSYMMVHYLVILSVKTPVNVIDETTYLVKSVYFAVMLVVYALIFKSMAAKKNWDRRLWSMIVFNMSAISIVMVLATLTETGRRTYGALMKAGHSGWFFSGNELSAILAMGFMVMLMVTLLEENRPTKNLLVVLTGLTAWAMLMVGTKVAFGSVLVGLAAALVWTVLYKHAVKRRLRNMTTVITLILVVLIMTPLTPIGNNLDFFLKEQQGEPDLEEVNDSETVTSSLLSGRKDFLSHRTDQYLTASNLQKIIGLGYAGKYDTTPKLTEMDLFDWGFTYGPVGLFLLILPVLYSAVVILNKHWHTRFQHFDMKVGLITIGIGLGLGAGAVAGHVLASPSASLYLCILLASLFILTGQIPANFYEKRMYDAKKVGNNTNNKHHVSQS